MSIDRGAELAAIGGKIPQIQRKQYTAIEEVDDGEIEEEYAFFRYIVGRYDEDDVLVCGSCQCPMTACYIISFVTGMLVFSLCLFASINRVAPSCLPAPYLYVSCHGHHNIFKYTRDGCLITDTLLKYTNDDLSNFDENENTFRGMVTGAYGDIDNALFVANAKGNSQVTVFGDCISNYTNPFSTKFDARKSAEKHDKKVGLGQRKRIADLIQESSVHGARHGYGIAIDEDGLLYVSFQDTSTVLRFDPATGYSPMPTLAQLNGSAYDGAIFEMNPVPPNGGVEKKTKGVRGIAIVEETLWVADEVQNAAFIIDLKTGKVLDTVSVINPIGIYYDAADTKYVFIGSKGKYGAEVLSFHRHSADKYHKTYYAEGILKHPAGMTSYNGTLYVADQGLNSVFKFDIETGKYLDVIVKLGQKIEKYTIEGIILSSC